MGGLIHRFARPATVIVWADNITLFTDIFRRLIKRVIAPLVLCTLSVGIMWAGALYSSIDKVSYVGGYSKSSVLFISLLMLLKATYRRAKTITLIVDNYIIHKSRETQRWLKQNLKFSVIYQPVYSPWVNRVER